MMELLIDGEAVETLDEDRQTVTLVIGGDGPVHRCGGCGDVLCETADGLWLGETSGEDCPAADAGESYDGLAVSAHAPLAVPLSWCRHAGVDIDESDDSVTAHICVGDPRGAFTFTVRRIPDDADSPLAGRLLLHLPYPNAPMGHRPLMPLHDGTYLIG
jgi:hypothetical protein